MGTGLEEGDEAAETATLRAEGLLVYSLIGVFGSTYYRTVIKVQGHILVPSSNLFIEQTR